MARRKTVPVPTPVVQGPPDPPAGVSKVNPSDCFVVVTFGYEGVGRPDEFYYGGPTEEGRAAAQAAAEAELDWRTATSRAQIGRETEVPTAPGSA